MSHAGSANSSRSKKPGAQLALTDDPAHQPRVRQRRLGFAREAALVFVGLAAIGGRGGFEAEGARLASLPRRKPFEPLGDLADLLGQPQQGQPVVLGKLAHPHAGNLGQGAAEGNYALSPSRLDEDLPIGLVEAAEHRVERGDGGRDDQLRASVARPDVEPRQRRQRFGRRFGAVEDDEVAQHLRAAFDQRLSGAAAPIRTPAAAASRPIASIR